MFQALLRGKLSREQDNLEDILTSNVFGLLSYLPPEKGLVPFLKCARFSDDTDWFGGSATKCLSEIVQARYCFWPWLGEMSDDYGCEPDVVIRAVTRNGERLLIVIEAKFRSGKSSVEDKNDRYVTDQLAREWNQATYLVRQRGDDQDRRPVLIYVTGDFTPPWDQVVDSASEFRKKRPDKAREFPFSCAWLSWRHIPRAFGKAMGPMDHGADRMLRDLIRLCDRLDLRFFEGLSPIGQLSAITWRFLRASVRFDWRCEVTTPIAWRFGT